MKQVQLSLDNETLRTLVAEQLSRLKEIEISPEAGARPDLVIARVKTAERVPHLLLGGKMEEGCEVLSLPLRLGDLTDRVRYMLSGRNRFANDATISFLQFELNALDGTMIDTEKNISVRLTDKEKLLILSLHAADGQALDRTNLLSEVWSYAENAETHTLETHLYRLRQKLEESFGVTDLIVTKDGIYTLKV